MITLVECGGGMGYGKLAERKGRDRGSQPWHAFPVTVLSLSILECHLLLCLGRVLGCCWKENCLDPGPPMPLVLSPLLCG